MARARAFASCAYALARDRRYAELIEDDDQREPRARVFRPVVEFPARRGFQHMRETLGDRLIGSTPEPPLALMAMRLFVAIKSGWKPEP
jgi:hypothetical protein